MTNSDGKQVSTLIISRKVNYGAVSLEVATPEPQKEFGVVLSQRQV